MIPPPAALSPTVAAARAFLPLLLLASWALAPASAASASPTATAPPVAEALPLAQLILRESDIGELPPEALAAAIDDLLTRLLIDEEHAALDSPQDLHHLVALALQVQLLERKGEPSPALRRAALSTAYLLHLMGHAYDTRSEVRAAIDRLPAAAPADRRPAFEALVSSVRAMRAYGRRWFPEALQAALRDDPQAPEPHDQRGLWLLREGRYGEAAEAFAQAFHHTERSRYALNLYDALIRAERGADARALYENLTAAAPALAGTLDAIAERWRDARATADFDARDRAALGVDTQLRQASRYLRVGREGAALVLIKELLADHGELAAVRHAAAEVYVATHRFGSLEALLTSAEAAGQLDTRLREARIAAVVQLQIERAQGHEIRALADVDLDRDLDALPAPRGPRVALLRAAIAIIRPLAALQGGDAPRGRDSRGTDREPPKKAALMAEVREAVTRGLKEAPRSPKMATLAVAAFIGIGHPLEGIAAVRRRLERLPPEARERVDGLLTLIEAGYAVRRRDHARLARAVRRLSRLGDTPPEGLGEAAWRYSRTILPLALEVLDGAPLPTERARDALDALPRLELDFDVTTAEGRRFEEGLAASLGGLLLRLDEREGAVKALKAVRRLAPNDALAKLCAGQAQLIHGDPVGAYEILSEALNITVRSATAFAVQKWLAYAANLGGDGQRGLGHIELMLALWDDAHIPSAVKPSSLRPLFSGDFRVELSFSPGAPLTPTLRASPVVLLLPEIPHERAQLEELVRERAAP